MSTTQSHWIMLALLMGLIPAYSKKSSEVTPDCGGTHVCTTLMRYRDNTTVDEGNNCICREGPEACSKLWEESDPKSLTWQHYERAHWSVQYKFCTPVFAAKSVCRPGEMAAVVETDVKTWAPYVSTPRCVCEDGGQVKMMGWRREGGVWKYFYFCDKAECPVPSETLAGVSVCA
ncbi:uncharacterized protein LOC106013316, partial [Aplysia californica]|uniref:Uncharacterized protein LOC106013316 n=1 Tax=Aplysia californica TaxID=6500 RepID=A0ABM1AAT8_APLCA